MLFRCGLKATSKFGEGFILMRMQTPLFKGLNAHVAPKRHKGTSFTTTSPTLIHPWNKHTKIGWNGNRDSWKRWGPESFRIPKKLTANT